MKSILTVLILTLGLPLAAACQRALPNPVLVFAGSEEYEANGKQWTRYKFDVFNREDYPDSLFAASPDLPPCGKNAKSSRAWVDLFDQSGRRLYGFCALQGHNDLAGLWFAIERGTIAPSWIYIEINDRKTTNKYKSNLAETTQ